MTKIKEKKCYSYISNIKMVFSNHIFVRETKDSDGICRLCGIILDGAIVDKLASDIHVTNKKERDSK